MKLCKCHQTFRMIRHPQKGFVVVNCTYSKTMVITIIPVISRAQSRLLSSKTDYFARMFWNDALSFRSPSKIQREEKALSELCFQSSSRRFILHFKTRYKEPTNNAPPIISEEIISTTIFTTIPRSTIAPGSTIIPSDPALPYGGTLIRYVWKITCP